MAIKPWEELTIQDDYMFKLIMRRKHICRRMLEKILRVSIRDIRYHEEEKAMKFGYDSKGVRLDVYLEADGTVIVVEMQVRDPMTEELAKRTRYYQSMIDLDMLKAGCKYKQLKPTVIIFLCPFDPYKEDRHIYTFQNTCKEDPALGMGDQTTKLFLNATGTKDDVEPDVKAFLDYVNGILSDDDFVKEIEEEIQKVKQMEEEKVVYMTYELKLEDAREEGERKGRAEGRAEGETKLGRLISVLIQNGKTGELQAAATDEHRRKQLYLEYNIN